MNETRYASLDGMRGFAVMGILLMNIVAFAMPSATYMNPMAYGSPGAADMISWAVMAVLVDGKMRALFSMMFGASMLLVFERAEAKAGNGTSVHLRRMLWLIAFGLVHYYFIWFGDILALYGACGIAAIGLLRKGEGGLKSAVKWTLGISFALFASIALALTALSFVGHQPGADKELVKSYQDFRESVQPSAVELKKEVALHRGPYSGLLNERMVDKGVEPLIGIVTYALETIGLMAIGMILLRNGFLTGAWEPARYASFMRRMYLFGIPPLILLNFALWYSGFEAALTLGAVLAWTMPFRIMVALGHGAAAMLIIKRFANSALVARVEAAGKAAFTNYLGTSILMTTLFYGYGGGLYGQLSLWQIYAIVPLVWGVMLLWSKPWLDRFHYGPLEWLWRSLAKGALQPMRRIA